MGDFRKPSFGGKKSFGGGKGFGGGDRGGDRGGRGGFGGGDRGGRPSFGRPGDRPAGFKTTCDQCHKSCEVPFRPNGEKPVYCNDCFEPMRDMAASDRPRSDRPERSFEKNDRNDNRGSSFGKHEFGGSSVARPGVDAVRFEEFKKQLDTLNGKVDKLLMAMNAKDIMESPVANTLENLVKKASKVEKNVEAAVSKKMDQAKDLVESVVKKAKAEAKPLAKAVKKAVVKEVKVVAKQVAKVAAKATKPAAKAKAAKPATKPAAKATKKK